MGEMKKLISALLSPLLLLVFSLPAFAMPPSVTDEAALLSSDEYSSLTEMLDEIRENYDMDVSVVTANELYSYSAEASADDIFDYNGYGCGEDDDGILFYICMGTREYHFSTHAYGMTVFNDSALIYLEDEVVSYLSSGDYYSAFVTYAEICEELLISAESGEYYGASTGGYYNSGEYYYGDDDYYYYDDYDYSYDYDYTPQKNYAAPFVIAIIASLVIAFVLTAVQLGKMETAVKQSSANQYMKPGSMNLTSSRDIYLYSHTKKTPRPKNNSSSGGARGGSSHGGGGHISSSGRTHGGRGGRF